MQKNQDIEINYPIKSPYSDYLRSGMGGCILIFLLLALISSVQALKLPEEYGFNECELIAKDYQEVYGGDLIFIQPLKDDSTFDLGDYNGHWINKVYNKNQGTFYFDYQNQIYFQSIDGIKAWYKWWADRNSEVFNINRGGAPFAIRYHY